MAVKASVTITISKYRDTDNITRYYKLQASTASKPAKPATLIPSGWTDTEPTYTSGSTNTLYFTDRYIFSDGTFQYTEVSKSTSYEAAKEAYNKAQAAQNTINNMEIGGRNYLIGSEKWNCFKNSEGIQITDDIAIKTGNGTNSNLKLISVIPGEQISISVDIKADVNFTPSDGFILHQWDSDANDSRVAYGWWKEPLTTEWKRYKTTITVPNDSNIKYYRLGIRNKQLHTLYFRHCKIEHGNKPTDWTPAPEDINNAIAKTVKTVDVEYYLSTSSTSVTGGSWSTTAPAWVDGKYMWSRQKVTYVDNTTATRNETCIAGAKGATGSPGGTGATGTGVESITEEYYLSTSKSSQTGGSWVTTPPTWSTGKYIWTRSKIVYKNPSSTVYTTPVCSSEWEAVNDVEIGGRNFLKGSKDLSGASFKKTIAPDTFNDFSYIDYTTESNSNYIDILTWNNVLEPEKSQYYTLSFWAKGTGLITSYFYPNNIAEGHSSTGSNTTSLDGAINIQLTSEWTRYWIVWKTRSDVSGLKNIIVARLNNKKTGHVCIAGPKFEIGNRPTDWSPAPEDTDADIDQVNKAVNEAHDIASNASTLANTAYTMVNSLNGSITNFVSGGGKYVRMDQSAEGGMQLNMGELSSALDDMIERLKNTLDETEAAKLKSDIQTAKETINGKTKYITADDKGPGGSPRIVLGDTSSPFKVEITNQSINFLQNGEVIAYANGTAFFNLRTVVQQDVQIGLGPGFIWKTRESGNMGLTWVPASS